MKRFIGICCIRIVMGAAHGDMTNLKEDSP